MKPTNKRRTTTKAQKKLTRVKLDNEKNRLRNVTMKMRLEAIKRAEEEELAEQEVMKEAVDVTEAVTVEEEFTRPINTTVTTA
jgi:hypothetical protein